MRRGNTPVKQKRRCANANGYSLHADVQVREADRKGLVRLLCYGMRPPFALERLYRLDDGRVLYQLKRPWPHFLRRLACLIPPPRRHLIRSLGVFAPHSELRNEWPMPPIDEPIPQCSISDTLQPGQLSFPFAYPFGEPINDSLI